MTDAGGQLDENTAARSEAATLVNSLPASKRLDVDGSNPWISALRFFLKAERRFAPRQKAHPKSRCLLQLEATVPVIEIRKLSLAARWSFSQLFIFSNLGTSRVTKFFGYRGKKAVC